MTATIPLAQIEADAERLAELHRRVSALAPGELTRPEYADRLAREVCGPLRADLAEAIGTLSRLEQACDLGEPELGDWGDHLEHTGLHEAMVGRSLSDELWQQVGNLAFAARSELRRAERALAASSAAHDERVVACESARRKLRRAIHALLEAIGHALGRGFDVDRGDAEVEAAIAVRRMYAKFRRSLPTCDPSDPAQVRRALRYSAVSLAVMIGSADFGDIRIQDRQLLLGLQARILAWARDGGTDAAGAQLYQDLQTAADLLRSINRRQELVAHDRAIEARLARLVADGRARADELRPALAALAGKDDALDAIAARDTDDAELVAEVRAYLTTIGAYPPSVEAA